MTINRIAPTGRCIPNLISAFNLPIYNEMHRFQIFQVFALAAVFTLITAGLAPAQSVPTSPPGKTIFRDSDGNPISNNEFVDIRMANFNYPDATLVKTLDDGTVEFRLQKIPQEGMRAADFTVRTLDGRTIDSADLKGKVVVLHFWFIGCPVCRAIKPKLDETQAKFASNDGVVFLAMTADPAGSVRKYLEKEPSSYLHAADAKSGMDGFVFSGFPKNIVISKTGEIVYWRSTIKAWDKFESVVRGELLK
jgi:thiol-disulfide isomerase/thioredoxin